ncbi:hypothetical protein A2V68_02675 [candidate division Kazan bacterium RBG_13_50_9]|uniref:Terminase large subunit gp17-like C-terminal domain-containing protein n=1 Tax=candidate division Kazan bacterium RBG_13_50_9 TaxID=1798535 RepID=A0A1F4NT10_UNCK3|nr:MAG: hypothetical protein A2V68_02675 [candidate division Kazan bacterium RBG_13_50_9]
MTDFEKTMKIIDKAILKKSTRVPIARKSHFMFFHMYMARYVKYETAEFQKEIFALTENPAIKMLAVSAFRGAAKSVILSLSFPLWVIMGEPQAKHILIFSKTQNMVTKIFWNIKRELSGNTLLKADLGPFKSTNDRWGGGSLLLEKYDARITVVSVDEGMRGIRHGEYRPDVIICDDVEDPNSTRTQEGRDKTYDWFTGDVIPAGDKNTRIMVVGNLLHEDSLMMRLKNEIGSGQRDGIFRSYPIIDDDGHIFWPGKYPDIAAIEEQKKTVGDEIRWAREYLLKIISNSERAIQLGWIHLWSRENPPDLNRRDFNYIAIVVDPAVSTKEQADKTAILCGAVFGREANLQVYILPEPEIVNAKLDLPTALDKLEAIHHYWISRGRAVRIWVEGNGFQQGLIQSLDHRNISVIPVNHTGDKRTRIVNAGPAIRNGTILFPQGYETEMVNQLIGYGRERYDDMADAVAMLAEQTQSGNTPNHDPIAVKGGLTDSNPSPKKRSGLRYDMDNCDPYGWGPAATG